LDDDDGAELEIEAMFKRRLMALRRLPRHQRPLALRIAKEWRALALKALREKRAIERHANHMARRQSSERPRLSG
jgi:hypothetical protein